MLAHPNALDLSKFTVLVEASVVDESGRRTLVKPISRQYTVMPPDYARRDSNALANKCEAMARECYSKELWDQIHQDKDLEQKLEGEEWKIQLKVRKILPVLPVKKGNNYAVAA